VENFQGEVSPPAGLQVMSTHEQDTAYRPNYPTAVEIKAGAKIPDPLHLGDNLPALEGERAPSIARAHGTKYNDKQTEDSAAILSGYTTGISQEEGEKLLADSFHKAREKTALDNEIIVDAGATAAAALVTDKGLVVRAAGDSPITLVGMKDGKVTAYQVTLDQGFNNVIYHSLSKNPLLDDKAPVSPANIRFDDESRDITCYYSWQQIHELVGHPALAIAASDGMYEYLHFYSGPAENTPEINEAWKPLKENKENKQLLDQKFKTPISAHFREKQMKRLASRIEAVLAEGHEFGGASFSEALIAKARKDANENGLIIDDLSLTTLPLPIREQDGKIIFGPQKREDYSALLLSDGAGGHKGGNLYSQTTIEVLTETLSAHAKSKGIAVGPITPLHAFDPDAPVPVRTAGERAPLVAGAAPPAPPSPSPSPSPSAPAPAVAATGIRTIIGYRSSQAPVCPDSFAVSIDTSNMNASQQQQLQTALEGFVHYHPGTQFYTLGGGAGNLPVFMGIAAPANDVAAVGQLFRSTRPGQLQPDIYTILGNQLPAITGQPPQWEQANSLNNIATTADMKAKVASIMASQAVTSGRVI
jgi:serine/threonine protein phosphatase PrpC